VYKVIGQGGSIQYQWSGEGGDLSVSCSTMYTTFKTCKNRATKDMFKLGFREFDILEVDET